MLEALAAAALQSSVPAAMIVQDNLVIVTGRGLDKEQASAARTRAAPIRPVRG
jgi:hypothetical protein